MCNTSGDLTRASILSRYSCVTSHSSSATLVNHLTCSYRPVYSLPSAPLSSSISIRTSDLIQTSNLRPSSAPSSSLNQSAIPGETPAIPPAQEGLSNGILKVTSLMYLSLLTSLFVAFVAMLGKQWINRYLENSGGSMIERCGNRRREFDGLGERSPRLFVGILLEALQLSLLLLVCGLCLHMWSINTSLASGLTLFSVFGLGFYITTVIAGASSYTSPFQTPVSDFLRSLWRDRYIITVSFKRSLQRMRVKLLPRCRRLPTNPLMTIQVQRSAPWLTPWVARFVRTMNAYDARCVSWVLRDITNPDALDAAIPFAATIRWFDGIDIDPPYDQIVSTFKACFDSTGKLYPGSRDRAYHSGQAMVWIHTLAMCKSEEFAIRFPLNTDYISPGPDDNLMDLLQVISVAGDPNRCVEQLLRINPHHIPTFTMDFGSTLELFLGQPDQTGPRVYPGPCFRNTRDRDHRPSGSNTQSPPCVVHIPWLAC